ncbi:hypothetical protein NKH77_07060 [Streptomyces sp. M19]
MGGTARGIRRWRCGSPLPLRWLAARSSGEGGARWPPGTGRWFRGPGRTGRGRGRAPGAGLGWPGAWAWRWQDRGPGDVAAGYGVVVISSCGTTRTARTPPYAD